MEARQQALVFALFAAILAVAMLASKTTIPFNDRPPPIERGPANTH
jgi:hypothetical protein